MNEHTPPQELWKIADDEANRMVDEINRLRAVLENVQITADYAAGKWIISDSMMDEIASTLGNQEDSEA